MQTRCEKELVSLEPVIAMPFAWSPIAVKLQLGLPPASLVWRMQMARLCGGHCRYPSKVAFERRMF
jgi:hypothetical protein